MNKLNAKDNLVPNVFQKAANSARVNLHVKCAKRLSSQGVLGAVGGTFG